MISGKSYSIAPVWRRDIALSSERMFSRDQRSLDAPFMLTYGGSHMHNHRRTGQKANNPPYVRIDLHARKKLNLTINEYALLAMIEVLARKTGWCFASRDYLGRALGISDRTVRRGLAKLRDHGLIEGSRSLRPTEQFTRFVRTDNLSQ